MTEYPFKVGEKFKHTIDARVGEVISISEFGVPQVMFEDGQIMVTHWNHMAEIECE